VRVWRRLRSIGVGWCIAIALVVAIVAAISVALAMLLNYLALD